MSSPTHWDPRDASHRNGEAHCGCTVTQGHMKDAGRGREAESTETEQASENVRPFPLVNNSIVAHALHRKNVLLANLKGYIEK